MKINVFDVERYATKDGPGIRTVVFLKGCNLRCMWCQNPESHLMSPQIMYYMKKCAGCGKCLDVCPNDAIIQDPENGFVTLHDRCTVCGACIDACFYAARRIVGEEYTVEGLMEIILKDKSYYEESDGGVTFSGGEPLLQPDAVRELARRCRQEGIHTALETAGYVKWDVIESVLPYIDLVFYDIKHIDSEEHARYIGAPNGKILENLKKLSASSVRTIVRIPVIPGVNDSGDVQRRIFTFLLDETRIREVELLPFHRLGSGKYSGLGMEYRMNGVNNLSKSDCKPFAEIGQAMGLTVRVGAV